MQPLTPKQKVAVDVIRYYRSCIFCGEHAEIDHVYQFARRQIRELWNYAPICMYHHRIGPMAKMNNRMIRETVEYHTLLTAKTKYEWCIEHGVPYKPIQDYDKTGDFAQRERYLKSKHEIIQGFLYHKGYPLSIINI